MAAQHELQPNFTVVYSKKIAPDGDRNAYHYGVRGYPRGKPITTPDRSQFLSALLSSNTFPHSMYWAENFTRIVNTTYRTKIFGQ